MGFVDQLLSQGNRIDVERQKFLDDPTLSEKLVAKFQRRYAVPEKKQEKLGYGADLAKVTAAIPSDDPRRDIGRKVMEDFPSVLEAYPGRDPKEILGKMYERHLQGVAEPTYKAIAKDRSTISNSIRGIFGGAPIESYAKMPGYDEWHSNEVASREPSEIFTPGKSAAWGVGTGLAGLGLKSLATKGIGGGLVRAGAKFLAPKLLGKGPWGTIAGLGLMAADFMVGDTAFNAVQESEWGRNRPVMGAVGGLAAAGVTGMAFHKAASKLFPGLFAAREAATKAAKKVATDPSLKNTIEYGSAKSTSDLMTAKSPLSENELTHAAWYAQATGEDVSKIATDFSVAKTAYATSAAGKFDEMMRGRPDLIKYRDEFKDLFAKGYNPEQAMREIDKQVTIDYLNKRFDPESDLMKGSPTKEPLYNAWEKASEERRLRNFKSDEAFKKANETFFPAPGEPESKIVGQINRMTNTVEVGRPRKILSTPDEIVDLQNARMGQLPETAETKAAEVVGTETSKIDTITETPTKHPWEMTRDELISTHEKLSAGEEMLEERILGKNLKEWRAAQRMQGSSKPEVVARAEAAIERIEGKLSAVDKNKLYGIGETEYTAEDLKGYLSKVNELDDRSPEALGRSIGHAITEVGEGTDPLKMRPAEKEAYTQIKHAFEIAKVKGWDTETISKAAIRAAAGRFSDPEDAKFMLDRFITKEPSGTSGLKALPKTELPSHAEQVRNVTEYMERLGSTPAGERALHDALTDKFGPSLDFLNPSSAVKFKSGTEKAVYQEAYQNYRKTLQSRANEYNAEIEEATKMALGGEVAPPKITSDIPVKVGDLVKFTNDQGKVHVGKVHAVNELGIPRVGGKGDYEFPITSGKFEVMHKGTPVTWGPKKRSSNAALTIIPTVLAGGALIGTLFDKNADAGVVSSLGEKVLKGGINKALVEDVVQSTGKNWMDVIKEFVNNGWWAPPVDTLNPKLLPEAMRVPSVKPDISNLTYHGIQKFWMKIPSPGLVGDYLYSGMKNGKRILGSPQPELAARTQAAQMNTERGWEVFSNIVNDIPGWTNATHAVRKAMKPIVDAGYYDTMEVLGAHKTRIDMLKDQIENELPKALRKAETKAEKGEILEQIEATKMKWEYHQGEFDKLSPKMQEMNAIREPIIRQLAEQFPSVRVELASRGEGMEWLKPMMSEQELEATGYLRKFYDEYAIRAKAVGERVISREPYGHFAVHPDAKLDKIIKHIEEEILPREAGGYPLAHLNHRAVGSFQVMPEMNYVMQRYLPDVNKRIQMADFWKQGTKDGWAYHAEQIHKMGWDAADQYWQGIKRAFHPYEVNGFNKAMRVAYAFEVAARLALSPSVAFKHAMKLEAPWSNFGIGETSKLLPTTLNLHFRSVGEDFAKAMGMKNVKTADLATQVMKSWISQKRMAGLISDLNLEEPLGAGEQLLQKFNEKGAAFVNFVEQFDRSHSFLASMDMAAKKGMTPQQAAYGVMDTILKTNFLSGVHNPEWLRNPKVRMLMMFQGTPFKIAEQRLLMAARAGKSVKAGYAELMNQLRADVKEGEQRFKVGLIKDALQAEKDIYGTPMSSQLVRKMMILGGIFTAGAYGLEGNLSEHLVHVPGVKLEDGSAKLNLNPMITSALQANKRGEDEFWLSEFFKHWLPAGPIPSIVHKTMRLSENDIPKIYQGSQFRYLFGIPSLKEE
jgi:hypothetical protein